MQRKIGYGSGRARELGYEFTIWTVERLDQHLIKVTGKQIVDERLWRISKEYGWVYRHLKEDLGPKQEKVTREWAQTMTPHSEEYDHIGIVPMFVQDMVQVWERDKDRTRMVVAPERCLRII
jgi:hypothetical protein